MAYIGDLLVFNRSPDKDYLPKGKRGPLIEKVLPAPFVLSHEEYLQEVDRQRRIAPIRHAIQEQAKRDVRGFNKAHGRNRRIGHARVGQRPTRLVDTSQIPDLGHGKFGMIVNNDILKENAKENNLRFEAYKAAEKRRIARSKIPTMSAYKPATKIQAMKDAAYEEELALRKKTLFGHPREVSPEEHDELISKYYNIDLHDTRTEREKEHDIAMEIVTNVGFFTHPEIATAYMAPSLARLATRVLGADKAVNALGRGIKKVYQRAAGINHKIKPPSYFAKNPEKTYNNLQQGRLKAQLRHREHPKLNRKYDILIPSGEQGLAEKDTTFGSGVSLISTRARGIKDPIERFAQKYPRKKTRRNRNFFRDFLEKNTLSELP
ncbi:MAG: hypothetical protein ACE5H1_08685 [Thermodesulfobacteriota bacterium]